MKFVINAVRDDRYDVWHGHIGDDGITACPDQVSMLFEDLTRALRARFEISNVRPRFHDYHTFKWADYGYAAVEITKGFTPCITPYVSRCIREFFENKGENCVPIYVSVY